MNSLLRATYIFLFVKALHADPYLWVELVGEQKNYHTEMGYILTIDHVQ